MYYVYVLKSLKDYSLYKGFSSNLARRIKEHNQGKCKSTSGMRPWKLVYFEEFSEVEQALSREKYFKTAAGRRFLKGLNL